jgi:hypothetical protein
MTAYLSTPPRRTWAPRTRPRSKAPVFAPEPTTAPDPLVTHRTNLGATEREGDGGLVQPNALFGWAG